MLGQRVAPRGVSKFNTEPRPRGGSHAGSRVHVSASARRLSLEVDYGPRSLVFASRQPWSRTSRRHPVEASALHDDDVVLLNVASWGTGCPPTPPAETARRCVAPIQKCWRHDRTDPGGLEPSHDLVDQLSVQAAAAHCALKQLGYGRPRTDTASEVPNGYI